MEEEGGARVGLELTCRAADVAGEETKPRSSASFSSTIRTEGEPSAVDVASAIACGTREPAPSASVYQRRNC